jgi:OmcA/MtrC family decaheme c-type cytochrome
MYMVSIRDAAGTVATAVGTIGAPAHDVVSDQACMACHGLHVWNKQTEPSGADHYGAARPQGVQPCLFCHNRVGGGDPRMSGLGVGLMSFVHGIHNSEAWPEGGYRPYWSPNYLDTISIGFPSYMNNCSICHDSPARLAQVTSAPMSWDLCSSCHGTAYFGNAPAGHAAFDKTTQACTNCHGAKTVDDFHNGLKTARAGLIWAGADQSVVWGNRVKMQIQSVGYDPGGTTTLVVTWTASWDPNGTNAFVAVNPCNADLALGPVFLATTASAKNGRADENMSLLRAYMQGDDFSNNLSTSSPGQPNSVNLRQIGAPAGFGLSGTKNTSCSGNVATTKVLAEGVSGRSPVPTRGIVAIQGKPQIRFDPALGTSTEVIQIRAQTPTREFLLATGAQPTAARRAIVDIALCNRCHVGSMYQHGGNRVDRIELCIMCHNPASTEQQNRAAYGVTPAEAYDGRVGQTYDLRTMVHAIHSAGEKDRNLVYYRSNGVYAFGSAASIAAIPNWKTTPKIVCAGLVEGRASPVEQYLVFGSDNNTVTSSSNTVQVPTVGGAGTALSMTDPNGACSTIPVANLPSGSTKGVYRTFNEIAVDYPRALNDCLACHVTQPALPNPNLGVAVTDDMGGSTVQNQLDDILVGPSAASCYSCHRPGDPTVNFQLQQHVYDNGWWPSAFPNGRQTLIDAVP